MRWRGPHPEVRQDLRDDLGLFDERENPHSSATAQADQRVHLVDLLGQPCPGALRGGGRDLVDFLDGVRRLSLALDLSPLPRLALLYQP